jgi:dATP pyrophosphohydrolase
VQARYDMIQCFVVHKPGPRAEFLQLLRAPGDYLGDTWQLVAGSIEPGETACQTVLRELKEETGLAPLELYHLDFVDTFYSARLDAVFHCPTFCAIVAADAVVKLNDEHTAYRWTAADQIEQLLMWPAQRIALVAINSEILRDGKAKPHLRVKL